MSPSDVRELLQMRGYMQKENVMRSDDEIRDIILEYFFQRNADSRSAFGKKKGAAATISICRKDLKSQKGLTMQDVQRNLTYLVSQKWIEVLTRTRAFKTRNGTLQPASTDYYRITAAGIDKLQGKSRYTPDKLAGINIGTVYGNSLVTIGDGNVVNFQYKELAETISEIQKAVKSNSQIGEPMKVEAVSDLASIQDQLSKASPNRSVLATLWKGVSWLADVDGLTSLVSKAGMLINQLGSTIGS